MGYKFRTYVEMETGLSQGDELRRVLEAYGLRSAGELPQESSKMRGFMSCYVRWMVGELSDDDLMAVYLVVGRLLDWKVPPYMGVPMLANGRSGDQK